MLEQIGDLETPPIPCPRFFADAKFGFNHLRDVTHAAVVADQAWVVGWVKFLNPLMKAEIRLFKHADISAARDWLKQAA